MLGLLGSLSLSVPSAQAYTLAPPRYSSVPQAQYQSAQEREAAEIAARKRAIEQARRAALQKELQERTPDPQKELSELNALTSAGEVPLLLYGGNDNRLLGCLNCNYKLRLSIWNNKGPYGSALSFHSIWNPQYEFGSELSPLCPWNPYASTPPVVVDTNGNFYGFLTTNVNQNQRFDNNFVATLMRDHTVIAKDSTLYYQKLFAQHLDAQTIPLATLERMPKPQAKDEMLLTPQESDYLANTHEKGYKAPNSTTPAEQSEIKLNFAEASAPAMLPAAPASASEVADDTARAENFTVSAPARAVALNSEASPAPAPAPAPNTITASIPNPDVMPSPDRDRIKSQHTSFDLSDSLNELEGLDELEINIDGLGDIGNSTAPLDQGSEISSDLRINFNLDLPEFDPQSQNANAH